MINILKSQIVLALKNNLVFKIVKKNPKPNELQLYVGRLASNPILDERDDQVFGLISCYFDGEFAIAHIGQY